MKKPTKPSAASRTVDMFGTVGPMDTRTAEVIEQEEKAGERVPVEDDADRMREVAFKGQEWTTKYFGSKDAPGNEYRLSHRGAYYYLETILKEVGKPTAYGYTGLMVHERDLMEMTKVMVAAVREKQAREHKE